MRGRAIRSGRAKRRWLAAEEARALLAAIDVSTLPGLRDRALIGLMVYTFARVGAAIGMRGHLSRTTVVLNRRYMQLDGLKTLQRYCSHLAVRCGPLSNARLSLVRAVNLHHHAGHEHHELARTVGLYD